MHRCIRATYLLSLTTVYIKSDNWVHRIQLFSPSTIELGQVRFPWNKQLIITHQRKCLNCEKCPSKLRDISASFLATLSSYPYTWRRACDPNYHASTGWKCPLRCHVHKRFSDGAFSVYVYEWTHTLAQTPKSTLVEKRVCYDRSIPRPSLGCGHSLTDGQLNLSHTQTGDFLWKKLRFWWKCFTRQPCVNERGKMFSFHLWLFSIFPKAFFFLSHFLRLF